MPKRVQPGDQPGADSKPPRPPFEISDELRDFHRRLLADLRANLPNYANDPAADTHQHQPTKTGQHTPDL